MGTGFSAPTLTTIMADPNIIGPQPDAGRIVQHFHGLAEELSKLSNVPALTEGNLIQHAVAQLTDQIQQSNVQINTQFNAQFNAQIAQINAQFAQRFDQLDNKIDTLTTRVIANDHNASARVQNSYLTKSSDRLTPLISPLTNIFIEWFPVRSGDIPNMENERLDFVLQELGCSTNGGREAKEKRLRLYIGLQPKPTGA